MNKNILVEHFFNDIRSNESFKIDNVKIDNSYHNKVRSKWSYCFTNKDYEYEHKVEDVIHIVSSVFDNEIKANNGYKELFKSIINGQGNEYRRITRLHSSSLCSFLHFYKINDDNSLKVNINGSILNFTKVFFEVKNYCIQGRTASMDVVLISPEANAILFLESKFAEYLDSGNTVVSKAYENNYFEYFGNYNMPISDNIMLRKIKRDRVEKILLEKKARYKLYTGGIKQMISHFISLENLIAGNMFEKTRKHLNEYMDKDTKLYLGEILFDFKEFAVDDSSLDNYKNEYRTLIKKLQPKNPKIYFLKNVLTYQDDLIYSKSLSHVIKSFYRYN